MPEIARPNNRLGETLERLREMLDEQRSRGVMRLPPEVTLSKQLGVGRSTLREALTRLDAEGAITRRRRTGTIINTNEFGTSSLQFPAGIIISLPDFLHQSGIEYEIRELTIRRVPVPDEHVAATFGIPQDAELFSIERVYNIDARPAIYVEHQLPTIIDGKPVRIESFGDAVITFLEQVEHISLDHFENIISAEAATEELAGKLSVEVGAPLLEMRQRFYSSESRVVSISRLAFRSDVISLSVTARGHLRLVR